MLYSWLTGFVPGGIANEILSSEEGVALMELLNALQDHYEYGFPAEEAVITAYFQLLEVMPKR